MAYIGKQPTIGNFVKLDAITTSATATYNLLNGGVAYSPQSANHCIVSLNGVIQSPTTSFTISGSTIVFASALTSSDVIDFILVLGDVLNIGTPSDNTVSTAKIVNGAVTIAKLDDLANPFGKELLHVRDEKAVNTDGGTSTSTTYHTRTLNTSVTNEISGASLASNQITLPAGTYYIQATAPAYKSSQHKVYLRNVTDSTDTLTGTASHNDSASNIQNTSTVLGRFTIAAQKAFEIRHYISVGQANNGLGVKTNATLPEVYTEVQIWKIA